MRDAAPVVVIGTGPAGAAAVAALVDSGVDVTVVEAGREADASGLTVRVGGATVFRSRRHLKAREDPVTVAGDPSTVVYEDMAPGGLTNHWSCAVPRFSQDDFDDARRAGDAYTWPVDYETLRPWYEWVEPYLQIAGAEQGVPQLPAGRVARAAGPAGAVAGRARRRAPEGQAVVPIPYVFGAATSVTRSSTIFNSFVRMIRPLQRAGRVHVHFGARATQLEWSGADKRVTAVIVRDMATGADVRIPCRSVVVAAGSINTTKILLQSTSPIFPTVSGTRRGCWGATCTTTRSASWCSIASGRSRSIRPPMSPVGRCDGTAPLYAAACLQWSGVFRLAESVVRGHPGALPVAGFNVFGTMIPTLDNYVALDPARRSADGSPGVELKIRYAAESIATLESTRDHLMSLLASAGCARASVSGKSIPSARPIISPAAVECMRRRAMGCSTRGAACMRSRTSRLPTPRRSPRGRRKTRCSPRWRSPLAPAIAWRTICAAGVI